MVSLANKECFAFSESKCLACKDFKCVGCSFFKTEKQYYEDIVRSAELLSKKVAKK